MTITNKILLIASILTISTVFSYGQSSDLGTVCAESQEVYGVDGFDDSEFIWSFDPGFGTVIEGNGTDTITILWGYATGTIQLEVLEITSLNCSNVPSIAEIEIMAPDVDLGYEFPEICDEDSLILDAGDNYEPEFSFLWNNGGTEQQYIGRTTEQIWLRVTDGFGCVRYDTVSLLVHPLPVVSLGNDTLICEPGSTYELIPAPANFSNYIWTISSTGEVIEGDWSYLIYPNNTEEPDTISLEAQDYNMCWANDTMLVFPCNYEGLFKDMPNTITPNDDGVNDVWNIPYMEFFEDAVLELFDRWGRLVYRTKNVYEEPWDGKSKGKVMPMDSYYYVLDLHSPGSKPIVGTVNLIR